MNSWEFTVRTPEEFHEVITYVLSKAKTGGAMVVTLTGDLGAGKTTFTQQLAKHLGVTESVTSPTFGIMKGYELPTQVADGREDPGGGGGETSTQNLQRQFRHLLHLDVYRFESVDEAGPLRLTELFADPHNLIVIEWPERIVEILPSDCIDITIKIEEGEERTVVVQG